MSDQTASSLWGLQQQELRRARHSLRDASIALTVLAGLSPQRKDIETAATHAASAVKAIAAARRLDEKMRQKKVTS